MNKKISVLNATRDIVSFIFSLIMSSNGRAVAQAVSRWLPIARARVRVRAEHVGFVVDKVALGKVFSEYFGFPCQSSFHQFLHHHNHPGAGTVGILVAAVPSGPNWTPPPNILIKKKSVIYRRVFTSLEGSL
jgi:hypothetical protein